VVYIKTGITLSLAEKLKQIRIARGVTQEKLAEDIGYSAPMINHFENGRSECKPNILMMIKKYLGLEGMPLLEPEREGFRDRLYIWLELINNQQMDKAKEMQKKLHSITYLSFDEESNALYNLVRCRLLLAEGNIKEAKIILEDLETCLNEADIEILYHYYYNRGTICYENVQYREALDFYTKAFDYGRVEFREDSNIHFNIACCYLDLSLPYNSIESLEIARSLNHGDGTNIIGLSIDIALAVNYIRIGQLKKAKNVVAKCYAKALSVGNKVFIGKALVSYGYLYRKAEDWDLSIDYLNQALVYIPKDTIEYLDILYSKIRCYVRVKSFSQCTSLLAEGKKLAAANEYYTVLFKSLENLMTLNDNDSTEYLENVAIPFLLARHQNFRVIDFCDVLREHYKKREKGYLKKSLQLAAITNDVYKEMFEGGGFYG